MERHLYEHFHLPGHSGFLNDISLTLIDKADPTDPTKWELSWLHIFKRKAPLWLNVAKLIVLSICDYVYGRIVFGQWFSDTISKFLLFLFCCCFVDVVVVVSGFVSLLFYYFTVLLLLLLSLLLLLLLLYLFIAFAQAVLNSEIFFLGELQLVAKGQEDAFTLHI